MNFFGSEFLQMNSNWTICTSNIHHDLVMKCVVVHVLNVSSLQSKRYKVQPGTALINTESNTELT